MLVESKWMDEPAESAEPGKETRQRPVGRGREEQGPLDRVEINDQKQDQEEPRSQ